MADPAPPPAPELPPAAPTPKEVEAFARALSQINEEMGKTSVAFNKLSRSQNPLIKSFAELGQYTESVEETVKNVTDAFKELGTAQGAINAINVVTKKLLNLSQELAITILSNSKELAVTFDKSRASYVLATGDIASYGTHMSDMMRNASKSTVIFGLDTSNASKLVRSSFSLMNEDFAAMNAAQRKTTESTMAVIASLEKLGVSTADSSKGMNLLIDEMTTGAAVTPAMMDASAKSFAATTIEINKMGYSLSEAGAMMAKHSDIVTDFGDGALTDLARTAKTTRIELDSLADLSKKFETFDSAAQHVGKLNALLGSDQLSVTEMMYAEPAEQVRMIAKAFDDAGMSVDNMSEQEKKFHLITIQNTLGLKSRAEAERFLNSSEFERAEQLEEVARKEEKSLATQEQLNQMLSETMDVLTRLGNAWKNFTSFLEPAITILSGALGWLSAKLEWLTTTVRGAGEGWEVFVGILQLITVAFLAFGTGVISSALRLTRFTIALGLTAGTTAGVTANTTALGLNTTARIANTEAAAASTPVIAASGAGAIAAAIKMLAFAAVIAAIGASVFLATTGIAKMAEAFKGLSGAEMVLVGVALTGLGYAMYSIAMVAVSLTPTYPALLAFAGVLLAIGLAVFLAAYGISLLVDSISGLISAFGTFIPILLLLLTPENIKLLVLLGAAFTFLAIGLGLLGIAMLLLIPGANAFSKIMAPMNEMVKDLSTTVASISNIFTTISELSVLHLLGVAGALWKISNAIDSFADKKINVEFHIVGDRKDFDSIIKLASIDKIETTLPAAAQIAQKEFKIEMKEVNLYFDNLDPLRAYMIDIAEGVADGTISSNR